MARDHLSITEELADYIRGMNLPEPACMTRLRQETAAVPEADMQISPEQGAFLWLLAKAVNARRAIEIGVFTGYSSLWVARALPEDGLLIACDVSERWTSVARRYWDEAGVAHKIDLRLKPALETLDEIIAAGKGGSFDFAFIDADKLNYWNYWERSLTLLRPGGMIAVDNVLRSGAVIQPAGDDQTLAAMQEFNRRVRDDERVWSCMLPMSDGITVAVKR